MTSASRFAHEHNSFWNTYTPALDTTVRAVNAGASNRFNVPMKGRSVPERNFIVNETAYVGLEAKQRGECTTVEEQFLLAKKRMNCLPGAPRDIAPLSPPERKDVDELVERSIIGLADASVYLRDCQFQTPAPGCGIIDSSLTDCVHKNTIVEFKSGDRGFRSVDFRQVLTYACLFRATGTVEIGDLIVINARRGVYVRLDLDEFVFDISGTTPSEFLMSFVAAVAAPGPSR